LTILCILAGASVAHAQGGDHRAGLVIRYGDGSVGTQCVSFNEPSLTGEELLQRSGLAVTLDYNAGLGGAICSINNQGCAFPVKDCFCKCTGLTCEYWAYYHWTGAWQYSQVGASAYQVTDGALEGWSWGAGNFSSGVEPPPLTFADVCPTPATATATTTPTATATAPPTSTVVPQSQTTPPQVVFEAQATELTPGACTLLRWWVTDATQLTLDGAQVTAQDQKQVCPPATQRFTLAAGNAAGQTVREVIVRVSANASVQATAQPTSTMTPAATPSRAAATQVSNAVPVLPTATVTFTAMPDAQPPTATPEPPRLGLAGVAVAHAPEIAPAATASAPSDRAPSSESVPLLVAPSTPTPRPRRQLGADGRPTPTPILLAYLQPDDRSGPRSEALTQNRDVSAAANGFEAPDRSFSLALLPGYGAYLLTLASVAGAGMWVARRKSNALRKS
jgi:hypothetical protein